jgi:cytochrome oxidase Cu insertion factor (SCO1/SenC/PrrC family)
MRTAKTTLCLAVTAAVLAVCAAAAQRGRPVAGQQAPVFTAKTVDGVRVSLGDLRGKVVLLNFWASY